MNKDLIAIFEYLERERGIKREIIIDAIKESLEIAAKKSVQDAENVRVSIQPKTGEMEVFCDKTVVEKVQRPMVEISLKEALKLDPNAVIDAKLSVAVTPKDFGRIAAQKARQIIGQKLRGAERDVIYEEYRHRIGQLISGSVKRIGRGNTLIVDLGKVEGIIPPRNYPITEKYHVGDRVLALLYEVRDTEMGGAEVVLSRSHPDFVKQLFIQEVPEIGDGTITIEKVVREAGYRTKIVVRSTDPKIDPVGSCIGMRGTRVKNISRELGGEKIDIIPFSPDRYELLTRALDPIVVRYFRENPEATNIFIVIDDENFAACLGKKGMNIRLLSQLVDAQLDVQKTSDYQKIQAIERANLATSEDPRLDEPISSLEGISNLVIQELRERFNTPRQLLLAGPDKLTEVPGVSIEMAEKLLEQIRRGLTS